MSLENCQTMKPIPWGLGEGRWDEIRLGIEASSLRRSFLESKNNRCNASHHRHGGVSGVGMLRRVMKLRGEILSRATSIRMREQQASQVRENKDVLAWEEVGKAHSSEEALVMRCGAKEPYFVDVNKEVKDGVMAVKQI